MIARLPLWVALSASMPMLPGVTSGQDASAATVILQHLDLNSFPNSTGPRREATRHTPADYGLTKAESFDDGWAQASEPEDGWHMAVFVLDGEANTRTICFTDAGGKGATYRATQALRITLDASGRWGAIQVADQVGCKNSPAFVAVLRTPSGSAPPALGVDDAARRVRKAAGDRRAVGGVARVRPDVVRLEAEDDRGYTFSVHAADGCLPGQAVCSALIGHYRVDKATGAVLDADRDPG